MSLIHRVLASLEARLSQPRLSLWRTCYVNCRLLPFSQAIHFPFFIYGRVKLYILTGSVEIKAPINKGMIKIGMNTESFSCFDGSGFLQICNGCKITFNGPAQFGINTKIRLVGANLYVGKDAFIGSSVRIICNGADVAIGDYDRIAFETTIMSSSFHYIYNTAKHGYGRTARPIHLGSYNWIGNRTTISAGTVTKSYTVVGTGSLLNRDYTRLEGDAPLLGGQPAKLLGTGFKRVFSPKTHAQIDKHFAEHIEAIFFDSDELPDNISDLENEF